MMKLWVYYIKANSCNHDEATWPQSECLLGSPFESHSHSSPSQGSPGHLDCNRRSASSLAPKSNYKVPVDGISSVGDVRLGMKPYISLGVSVTSMTFVGPLKNADPPLGLSPDICD